MALFELFGLGGADNCRLRTANLPNFRNWARQQPMRCQTSEIWTAPTEHCHDKLFKSSLAAFRVNAISCVG
jgi:hypothetical protein